ncbi:MULTISPECIES: hypothetical protein [Lysinibacillus]|uniref:hypothetical protein n=1 Tax=Lysinibacillus TaxID=400634 RepID=UPI00083C9C54|nr:MULTISPECIES: hypothetical protein [Lysinibacillus]
MKKLIFSAAFVLSLGLAGCGDDAAKEEKSKEETQKSVSTDKTNDSSEKDDVQENANLKAINTYTNKELGIRGQSGPILYNIEAIN